MPVNIIRIFTALVLFSGYMMVTHGVPLPLDFPLRAWMLLSLSGIIGFFLGDICLFQALVEIGPRITMVIFSLAAPVSALIGWVFLGEDYAVMQWAGMGVTLTGVSIVILEKNHGGDGNRANRTITPKGLFFGICAMMGQAVGFVLSKSGMQTDDGFLDAFAATQVRALAAFACFVLFFTLTRKWGVVGRAVQDRRAVALTATGSVLGPFIGVSLSLLTLHYLTTGVASTILSLTPVAIIPFAVFVHKEHVSMRAVSGALIAVAGIWLLTAH